VKKEKIKFLKSFCETYILQKVVDNKMICSGKICSGLFWEVNSLMKKAKNATKKPMNPDSSAMEGMPAQDPQEDYAKKDSEFKKRRGARK
jgi:hypothetical protein